MRGKVIVVTGATAGIGRVTARALAGQGAAVIVVGRNPRKGATVVDQIRQKTGNRSVEFMLADLSVQADIRRLAQRFQARYERLDVLVNNAGAIFMRRQESADGIEMTFALNHLNYFLLTNLLLDSLKAAAPARVVNVSSGAHHGAPLNLADLQGQRRYSGWRAYQQSKLANILFTYELDRRLERTGVTANALHPGFVATNFGANNGPVSKVFRWLGDWFAISEEEGAKTNIYLAASPEVEGVTGKYFYRQQPASSSPASHDREAARRLWDVSAEMTGLSVSAASKS